MPISTLRSIQLFWIPLFQDSVLTTVSTPARVRMQRLYLKKKKKKLCLLHLCQKVVYLTFFLSSDRGSVLTRYLVKKKEFKVKKLVGGKHDEPESEKQEDEVKMGVTEFVSARRTTFCQCFKGVDRKKKKKKYLHQDRPSLKTPAPSSTIASYWHQNLTLNVLNDYPVIPYAAVPPELKWSRFFFPLHFGTRPSPSIPAQSDPNQSFYLIFFTPFHPCSVPSGEHGIERSAWSWICAPSSLCE